MNKTFCDRCGCEIPKNKENAFKLNATGQSMLPVLDNLDICPDCLRKLKVWMEYPSGFKYFLNGEWVTEDFLEVDGPEQ